jgi:hypothetical protein
MKRLLIGFAALAASLTPGSTGAGGQPTVIFGQHPDNCSLAIGPVGPNGWRNADATCWAPLQAQDKMFRVEAVLIDGFDRKGVVGPYRDCNHAFSESEAWINANWQDTVIIDVSYVNDTKPGGC